MVLATLTFAMSMGMAALEEKPLVCPIMGSEVSKESPAVEYAGTRVAFCCGGCDGAFAKDPLKAFKDNAKKGNVVGVFLFDPVSGLKIDAKKAKASSDYLSTRYYFASAENKAMFDKDSKKFATVPKKEHLQCSVEGCEVVNYADSSGYVDYKGVRYFAGCEGCIGKLIADPAKYATQEGLSEPKVIPVKKK